MNKRIEHNYVWAPTYVHIGSWTLSNNGSIWSGKISGKKSNDQGCQIFRETYTKIWENVPNGH
jgi:hypothetical protein